MYRHPIRLSVLALALVLPACGGGGQAADAPGTNSDLVAAVSLAPYEDLVERVGGDRIDVREVVPDGLDGHTYEPTPSDVRTFADADIVFLPGADLNPRVTELAQANVPDDASIVDLNALTMSNNEWLYIDMHSHGDGPAHGHDGNPHTWTNIPYAARDVKEIATALTAVDPDGAGTYAANRDALLNEIDELDIATREAIATIPKDNRTLVVYHDSWSYFGREYGFDVIGALQAVDFAEPSASEMRNMVGQVEAAGVPGFFGSVVFPTSVLEQVAAESGVAYVGNLSDDALPGDPGDPEHSYVGMMVANVRTIVEGLGGDASALDRVDPAVR